MILEHLSGSPSTACKIKPIISVLSLYFKLYNTTLVRYVAILGYLCRQAWLDGFCNKSIRLCRWEDFVKLWLVYVKRCCKSNFDVRSYLLNRSCDLKATRVWHANVCNYNVIAVSIPSKMFNC